MARGWPHGPLGFVLLGTFYAGSLSARDASTGAIRGTVADSSGARIAGAQILATNEANGLDRHTLSDGKGAFAAQLLSPGDCAVQVSAPGMQTETQHGIRVEIGSAAQVSFQLRVAGKIESIIVHSSARVVEAEGNGVSSLIDSRAISELPLASRRFTDLALLTPGVTQDPRGLTAGSNGDLSFGGVRGFQTSFLVDGADNNNGFFSQARGGYHAPYQFSDEVVSEFRVASNSYGAEHGRAGGAVINVVTKSGGNQLHGSSFYSLRDSALNAEPVGVNFRPPDRRHQGGFTLGGPLRKNRVFLFAGRVTNNLHLSLLIEAFNMFNELDKRVVTDACGFFLNTAQFVPFSQRSGATYYPAQYRKSAPTNGVTGAYAPRQVQVAVQETF